LSFAGHRPFTMEAWVKPAAAPKDAPRPDGTKQAIFSKSGEFVMYLDASLQLSFMREVKPAGTGQAISFSTDSEAAKLSEGVWSHVATTYDGVDLRLFVNGTLSATYGKAQNGGKAIPECPVSTELEGSHLLLGADRVGASIMSNGQIVSIFQGEIDETRLWDVARTADEIVDACNRTLSSVPNTLLAYHTFDEGKGATSEDMTGLHHNLEFARASDGGQWKPSWPKSTAPLGTMCPNKCSKRGRCDMGTCKCSGGFGGPDCMGFKCPADCSGHGTCNFHTGICDCKSGQGKEQGWQGADCATPRCPKDCMNRGQCVNGQCICSSRYTGDSCELLACPAHCNHHGRCKQTSSGPVCICDKDWRGEACQTRNCPPLDSTGDCNGKGMCNQATGKCFCNPTWSGDDCSVGVCPSNNCNGHGSCKLGESITVTEVPFRVELALDFAFVSASIKDFSAAFSADIAAAVGVPSNRVEIDSVAAGSVHVELRFTAYAGPSPSDLFDKLIESHSRGEIAWDKVLDYLTSVFPQAVQDSHEGPAIISIKRKEAQPDAKSASVKTGKCTCEWGWTGDGCQYPTGPTGCPNDCMGRGKCVGADSDGMPTGKNPRGGTCQCESGPNGVYKMPNCRRPACPKGENGLECSGIGACMKDGTCQCPCEYHGSKACESKDGGCPKNCNGRGKCVCGKCFCQHMFLGPDCGVEICPEGPVEKSGAGGSKPLKEVCSGHGQCTMQGCKCQKGFTGEDCGTDQTWPSKHVTVCFDDNCETRAGYFFKDGMKNSVETGDDDAFRGDSEPSPNQ